MEGGGEGEVRRFGSTAVRYSSGVRTWRGGRRCPGPAGPLPPPPPARPPPPAPHPAAARPTLRGGREDHGGLHAVDEICVRCGLRFELGGAHERMRRGEVVKKYR